MNHTMKLWERVVDRRIQAVTTVRENQFGFRPGHSTSEPIFILKQMVNGGEALDSNKKPLPWVYRCRKGI